MKNKTVILISSLIAFVSICFTACENQIINKWWVEPEPKAEEKEPEYIPLLKILPGTYDTIIEEKIVYKTIFVKLPPEKIIETVYVDKPVYQIIYEQLPPEIIYQVITETVPEYITNTVTEYVQIPPDENTIIEWLTDTENKDDVKEIIKKIKELYPDEFIDYVYVHLPPEIIYQEVEKIKIEYVDVYHEIETIINIPIPPDEDTIIQWLTDTENKDDVKEIIEKIKELYPDEFIDYVYVHLPPEIIYQGVEKIKTEYVTVYQDVIKYIPPDKETIIKWLKDPANQGDVEEIIREIKELIPVDVIKEIIKEIPPKDIMDYLTDEQIQYIVKQQPPQKILQSIKIIGIEYVLFAGDSSKVNGPHGTDGQTDLTPQEINYNTTNINEMAQLLKANATYIIMLHGHANPVTFTAGETEDLEKLSNDRANDVRRVLMAAYNKIDGNQTPTYENPGLVDRVSTSGYGGEKVLFGSNTQYTALNRRVEMILFEIITTVE